MKPIEELLYQLEAILDLPIEEYPQIKAMEILRDYFYEFHIPIKHIGKVKLDIDNCFFIDEEIAQKILKTFALVIQKIYNSIVAGYGDDAEYIFGDVLKGMSISCLK